MGLPPQEYGPTPEEFGENWSFALKEFHIFSLHICRNPQFLYGLSEISFVNRWAQRAKKVMSDSPGLVDFAIGLVIFVLDLPNGQVLFFREIQLT